MISKYLVKYVTATGKYTWVDPSSDIFDLVGIRLGGVLFDQTNIVTVSGVNSQLAAIQAVSGASSIRDDLQDAARTSSVATLNATIVSVSGALHTVDVFLQGEIEAVSGTLQSEIQAILNDRAKEERFEAVSGQILFTLSTIAFDPSATVHDIQVYKNGLKSFQSMTGSLAGVSGGDFVKIGTTQVQYLYGLRDGDRVIVRDERTGAGSGGVSGGSADLTHITSDLVPDVDGFRTIGTTTKGFSGVILRDTVTTQKWELQINNGVLAAVLVG